VIAVFTVARLAVRELWISYRILAVVGAFLIAGASVALLPGAGASDGGPGSSSGPFIRLAVGLMLGSLLAACVGAWSLADERRRGRVAWLVSRTATRPAILGGWFAALAAIVIAGVGPSIAIAWLALAALHPALEGVVVASVSVALIAGSLSALAGGMLAGTLLEPWPAALATLAACGAVGAVTIALPGLGAVLPGAGHLLLSQLPGATRPVAGAIESSGLALTATASLLVLAGWQLARADL
jgi:hypothetical protein